mmetsp:Transcript_18922/g.75469  ORF Transcript_18922/g.75469 Transcript_18922/m.75469 type:complete len:428 (-) Transcript_18922:135-1418(-)
MYAPSVFFSAAWYEVALRTRDLRKAPCDALQRGLHRSHLPVLAPSKVVHPERRGLGSVRRPRDLLAAEVQVEPGGAQEERVVVVDARGARREAREAPTEWWCSRRSRVSSRILGTTTPQVDAPHEVVGRVLRRGVGPRRGVLGELRREAQRERSFARLAGLGDDEDGRRTEREGLVGPPRDDRVETRGRFACSSQGLGRVADGDEAERGRSFVVAQPRERLGRVGGRRRDDDGVARRGERVDDVAHAGVVADCRAVVVLSRSRLQHGEDAAGRAGRAFARRSRGVARRGGVAVELQVELAQHGVHHARGRGLDARPLRGVLRLLVVEAVSSPFAVVVLNHARLPPRRSPSNGQRRLRRCRRRRCDGPRHELRLVPRHREPAPPQVGAQLADGHRREGRLETRPFGRAVGGGVVVLVVLRRLARWSEG